MSTSSQPTRGALWIAALTGGAQPAGGYPASVTVIDAALAGESARFIAVVRDENHRFPRVHNGEVGLVEGWTIARAVDEVVEADRNAAQKRPIVAVIDVPSQAYGRREEAFGIHQALAGAAGAYAKARLAGHPVIGLIVGKAMSGGFLAHGYQANRLIALDDGSVMVHAMGKASAARITLRTVEELEKFAATVPPMAYDIGNYATLGLLWTLQQVASPDAPGAADTAQVTKTLEQALADIRKGPRDLSGRLNNGNRRASLEVRNRLRAEWDVAGG
ncbi:MAG: biotin-independent malonate decarboxylase subunit gamma [Paludibacterium sp.]|uniref:biotin-independent malonate decarboxylase subunit gamma n=1 Tax=Paludibacterium sp. TaxID=1917523 RepID=UPI0025D5815B|nr:biotin-independent malonate decarboxylase subunit gamma [Paludibacterium sp.]MBV8047771.1 biotin-independent malonate decarboxylase subunit gamma [Paludibacterium sp.]MBV8648763.1 biotin-independent malonate decarboxylase subunit gamma [Paludibacterium sp.]